MIAVLAAIASAWSLTAYASPAEDGVPVQVHVKTPAGDHIADGAYVALVPPYASWSQPLAEGLTTSGKLAFVVPPGSYYLVAGAASHGVTIQKVRFETGRRANIDVIAAPLKTVSGTIRDDEGRPLANAIIADVNSMIEPPLGRLSVLAQKAFGQSWRTRSGHDGAWSLRVPHDSTNPLVADAPGYAPAWVSPDENRPAVVEFVLGRGGSLRLRLNRVDPQFAVTLVPRSPTVGSVPSAWQRQYWARIVGDRVIEWGSLPPGSYGVYAQQRDRTTFAPAVKLGEAIVESDVTAALDAELPSPVHRVADLTTILFESVDRNSLENLNILGRDRMGGPRVVRHALDAVAGGTLVYVDGTQGGEPFIANTSDKIFTWEGGGESSRRGKPLQANVHPLGRASLRVRSAVSELALPIAGITTLYDCGDEPKVEVPVAVRSGGEITFNGPADCTSFSLDLPPFAPLAFSRSLYEGPLHWLGDFTLYAAGRARVRVLTNDQLPFADATVNVFVNGGADGSPRVQLGTESSNIDGWAYFDRLPVGRDLVLVAENLAGDSSDHIRFHVQPGLETSLDNVVLQSPATLILEPKLEKSFLDAFPGSRIEAVVLEPEAGDTSEPVEQAVPGSGRVEFSRMHSGRWQIVAVLSAAGIHQPVDGPQVELKSGEVTRLSPTFAPLVFRGRVTARGEGLRGMIDIRGPRRSDIVPAVATSTSGSFQVVLARPDTYQVNVRTSDPPRLIWIGEIAFTDPTQPVEISVPTGEVIVKVRSGQKALQNVLVTATTLQEAAEGVQTFETGKRTDTRGQARIEGLLPGRWLIAAATEQGAAQAQKSVTVSGEVTTVELELLDRPTISGTLREVYGAPVAGATIECIVQSEGGAPQMATTTTAEDGTFVIRRDFRGPTLCSVASFAGVQGYRLMPGESNDLTLPPLRADLHIPSLLPINRLSSMWLVSGDGRFAHVSDYMRSVNGSADLRVPGLAVEEWTLVRISSLAEWLALAANGAARDPVARITFEQGRWKSVRVKDGGQ